MYFTRTASVVRRPFYHTDISVAVISQPWPYSPGNPQDRSRSPGSECTGTPKTRSSSPRTTRTTTPQATGSRPLPCRRSAAGTWAGTTRRDSGTGCTTVRSCPGSPCTRTGGTRPSPWLRWDTSTTSTTWGSRAGSDSGTCSGSAPRPDTATARCTPWRTRRTGTPTTSRR